MTQPVGSGMPEPVTFVPPEPQIFIPPPPQITPLLDPIVGGMNPDVTGNNAYFNNLSLTNPSTISGGGVNSSLIPVPPSALDLGSPTNHWRNLYVDTIIPNPNLAGNSNILVNGGMRVSQRGVSFTTPATATFTLDRWQVFLGAGSSFSNIQQITNAQPYGANIFGANGSFSFGATGNQFVQIIQFSDGNYDNLRTKQISLSAWIASQSNNVVSLQLTTDGTGAQNVLVPCPGGNVWTKLTATVTVPIDATRIIAGLNFSGSTVSWAFTEAMLVPGPNPIDYIPLTAADDLARCLRYYQVYGVGGANTFFCGGGVIGNTTSANFVLPFKQQVAITPTITFLNSVSDFVIHNGAGPFTCTAINQFANLLDRIHFVGVVASGLIVGQSVAFAAANVNAKIIVDADI